MTKKTDKTELIERTEIENSPFVVITTEGQSFGTMGHWRLTEPYDTKEEAIAEMEKITWNRIIQVMMLISTSEQIIKDDSK